MGRDFAVEATRPCDATVGMPRAPMHSRRQAGKEQEMGNEMNFKMFVASRCISLTRFYLLHFIDKAVHAFVLIVGTLNCIWQVMRFN